MRAPACALWLLTAASVVAQTLPGANLDDATLAKYDKNKNGRLDVEEQIALDADLKKAAGTTAPGAATSPNPNPTPGEVIFLSPFQVTSDNQGYYATNTVSATRFNARLEDLAASITVVTKDQMQDFAMVDLNDVFLYTASTEGTGTYTDFAVDRNGSVSDNVQLNPTQANRVRGIGSANVAFGNFETMGRVPVDPVGIEGVEVSRGPNASVFGLGNPSGTVNLVPSSANLNRDRASTSFRADSYDGYRTSLDVNRVLSKGTLAVRATGVFQHEGFVRKPSGVDTERYSGMIKYQPFRSTAISGSVAYYHSYGNRPNFSPPRDSISYWLASGRPTWDPVTQQVHLNGATVGTYPAATYNGPDYFNNSFTGNNHSVLFIDRGGVGLFAAPSTYANTTPLPGATAAGPTSGATGVHFVAPSSAAGVNLGRFTAQPLFTTTPTVTDRALYDWSSVNLAAVNHTWDRTLTSTLQLDQLLYASPVHMLVLQAGLLREDSQRYQRNHIGIANDNGQSGQLQIDVNECLLDGTPNPYFLRPYIGQDQPRTTSQPAKWDSYRVQLGYRLDLTRLEGPLKWLGLHQFSAYDEYKYRVSRRYSYREAILDAQPWIPAGQSRGNQTAIPGGPAAALAITRSYLRYYVGDNQGANVDYAPGDLRPGTYPFVWGNATTGVFKRDPALLGLAAVTDATGGVNNSKTILKTLGGVVQSHFLNERIVTTLGLREDQQYQKFGATPQLLNADGITFNSASINHWAAGDYRFNSGRTTQAGVVVRPFRGLSFLRNIDDLGALGHFAATTLHGLSLTYNKAGSFTPQDPRTDIYLRPLPNPSGRGKEYGFALNTLDGKFVLRFNRYDTTQLNRSGGDAGVIAQRLTRMDVASTAPFLLATQAANWVRATNPAFTEAQVQAEAARQIGLPLDRQAALVQAFNAGTLSSMQDVAARGTEIELNFNPVRYWTVAGSITETRSINTNVSPDLARWIAERLPVWITIKDPTIDPAVEPQQLWWNHNYGGSQTAAQNYASFIQAPFSVVRQLEGKSNPQVRRYAARVSTNLQLAGLFPEHRFLKRLNVGGAVRWEDRAAIGYYGVQSLPAVITDLDASRPIYDRSNLGSGWRGNYYFDAFVGYRTRLWSDKIGATFQLNVRNLQENGRLQAIGAFPDGTPHSYRIVDPRQFILQATFDL